MKNKIKILENRFILLNKLAEGGMGIVYKGKVRSLNKIIAIKLMNDWASNNQTLKKRFNNELKKQAKLNHPNILNIFDANVGKKPFIILEFAKYGNLIQALNSIKPSFRQRLKWGIDIGNAITYLHKNDIIHRDLKPQNILFVHPDIPKISDFGLCLSLSDIKRYTKTGQRLGSRYYMSPEQQISSKHVSFQSDIYSLGVIYYFLFHNKFKINFKIDQITWRGRKKTVEIPNLNKYVSISPKLDKILKKMLHVNMTQRYSNMEDILTALKSYYKNVK